jgi:biofilm PGA synthesis N-glycosyltransferase PgaC
LSFQPWSVQVHQPLRLGFLHLCNGANLAFTKDAFTATGGYDGNEHIASGDDEFLMRKIEAKYSNGIRFNNNPENVVTTYPQKTINSFSVATDSLGW